MKWKWCLLGKIILNIVKIFKNYFRSEIKKLANSSFNDFSESFYLKIDRKNVFQDCFNYILRAPLPEFLHKNFYITFNGEEGSDQGFLIKNNKF